MESIDVPTIYEVPQKMHEQHLDEVVLHKLNLPAEKEPDMAAWNALVDKIKHPAKKIEIALVGKYTELPDAYKSICESFVHAGAVNDCKVKCAMSIQRRLQPENVAEKLGRMSVSWWPRASATAVSKVRSSLCAMHVRTTSRSWESASVCSAP